MARPKGQPKLGGRTKGTPNKKTEVLMQRAEALGIDPFDILLLFAKGDWKSLGYKSECKETRNSDGTVTVGAAYITPESRLNAAKEAAQYLHAKRKAVELSGPDGAAIDVNNSEGRDFVQAFKETMTGYVGERSKK